MLLVANLANTKWCRKPKKWLKPWHMGTHLRVLGERQGLDGFQKYLRPCALDEISYIASALEGLKVVRPCLRSCCKTGLGPILHEYSGGLEGSRSHTRIN